MMKLKLLVSILAISTITSQATESYSPCNFVPKNDLKIPVGANLYGGIDEDTFNKVIDNVASYYAPIVSAWGGILKINRLWTDSTVNASAQRQGRHWILNMYGGLARHPVTTEDGFALVLCHEMGHHLGGFPQSADRMRRDWASNEGQADYFATMKCFRRVYENEDNASAVSLMQVPVIVKSKCSDTFKTPKEINLCIRDAMAGNTLALLLWSLSNGKRTGITSPQPSFDTPDSSVVDKTDDDHPIAQCRMDTYLNGSICGVDFNEDFGKNDPSTGACAMEKGDKTGYRPVCWYKPEAR